MLSRKEARRIVVVTPRPRSNPPESHESGGERSEFSPVVASTTAPLKCTCKNRLHLGLGQDLCGMPLLSLRRRYKCVRSIHRRTLGHQRRIRELGRRAWRLRAQQREVQTRRRSKRRVRYRSESGRTVARRIASSISSGRTVKRENAGMPLEKMGHGIEGTRGPLFEQIQRSGSSHLT